jgi:hypothetical protein
MQLFKYVPLTWSNELTEEEKARFLKRCENIRDDEFWFAKPETLNDPYDCYPFFNYNYDLATVKKIFEEWNSDETELILKQFPNCKTKDDIYQLLERIMESEKTSSDTKKHPIWALQAMLIKLVRVKIANTGILCFTENPKDILMWAHYANNHRGICLDITIPEDTHSLKKLRYTVEQPYFAIHEAMNERHGKLMELFYTKSIHWQHEKEWRMVAREGNIAREIPGASIAHIIYGINTSEETKDKISEVIGSNIPSNELKMKRDYLLDYST